MSGFSPLKDLLAWGLRMAPRRAAPAGRDLVLCYHGVDDGYTREGEFVDPKKKLPLATFRRQLDMLSQIGRFVPLHEMYEAPRPERGWRFAITFDDGYRNNIEAALPVLEEYRAPLTWFVASAFVENRHRLPWWDLLQFLERHLERPLSVTLGAETHELGTTPATPGRSETFLRLRSLFLERAGDTVALEQALVEAAQERGISLPRNGFADPEALGRAAANGLVEIGAHTHTHINMARTSGAEIGTELTANVAMLRDWTGFTPRIFAYPYGTKGAVSAEAADMVRSCGFDAAVTTRRDYLGAQPDTYQLPRLTVQLGWSDAVFRSRVVALDRWNLLR